MSGGPSTPTLSLELKALIEQRNILTSRTKSKVIKDLNKHIMLDQQEKQIELRAKAIEEILMSEVSYLNQLEITMKFFRTPLQEFSNFKIPDPLKTMFDHFESLYNVNGELLNELRKHGENVAEAFITVAPFFKLYSAYAYGYRQGLSSLQELRKSHHKLDAFIKCQETRPEVCSKLGSLLISPIQRIPRYRLLLKELLSHTPETSPQYSRILEAIKNVESATEHINSLVSDQENMQRIIVLQKSLCGGRPTIVHPGRKLIKEGILMKVSKKAKKAQQRYFVLMSDVVMYCKMTGVPLGEPHSLRCSCVLPLQKCTVESPTTNDKVFTINCNGVSLVLFSDEPHTTESWITAINQTIQMENEGRQTLKRKGSSRPGLKQKDLNVMSDAMTPRKRKKDQEDIDISIPFHSPWKRNKITLAPNQPLPNVTLSPKRDENNRRQSYFGSLKKAVSNLGNTLQKYWIPLYAGRRQSPNRRLTN